MGQKTTVDESFFVFSCFVGLVDAPNLFKTVSSLGVVLSAVYDDCWL